MCIIIVKPPNTFVSRQELKEAFRVNGDGAGLMYNDNGQVKIFKGWFAFRKFYKRLRELERGLRHSTFVIHMRIGTSGERNSENCHPFRISPGLGFVHNGIMRTLGDKVRSDTREFAEDILCHLPDDWLHREEIVKVLERCATESYSKYVFLSGDGTVKIFNESAGHWKGGCWFSNHSYVCVPSGGARYWDNKQMAWVNAKDTHKFGGV